MFKYTFDEQDIFNKIKDLAPQETVTPPTQAVIDDGKDDQKQELLSRLNDLSQTISQLENQKAQLIQTLDLDRLQQLNALQQSYRQQVNDLNAQLSQLSTKQTTKEYKDEVFKKLNEIKTADGLVAARQMYGDEIVDEFIRTNEFNFNYNYLIKMPKADALNILNHNTYLKQVLQQDFDKLVNKVKDYVGENC